MVSVPVSSPGGESTEGERRGFGKGRRREEPSFEALPDSIPPQNLEAEEAVLGGILLDPDAIGRVADAPLDRRDRASGVARSPVAARGPPG